MSRRPAQNPCTTFTLNSTGKKVLMLHSALSPTAKEVEDHYFGVSDDSGDVKERRFVNCRFLILYESK